MENETRTEAINRASSVIIRDQPLVHAHTNMPKHNKQKEKCEKCNRTKSFYLGSKTKSLFVLKLNCKSGKNKSS